MDRSRHFETLNTECHVAPSTGVFAGRGAQAVRDLFRANGILVQLRGVGGDQVFCGDRFPPLHLSDYLRTLEWSAWARHVGAWLRHGEYGLWDLVWNCSRGSVQKVGFGVWNACHSTWLLPSFQTELAEHEHDCTTRFETSRLYSSPATELHYRTIVAMQPGSNALANNWDVRYPLLHRPLVEFMLGIPWQEKIAPGEDRVIQRRALKGVLPETVRTRKTKGDHTPLLLKGLRTYWSRIRPYTHGRHLESLGVVDPHQFRAACERLRHGFIGTTHYTDTPFLLAAISLEMWLALRESPMTNQQQRSNCGSRAGD